MYKKNTLKIAIISSIIVVLSLSLVLLMVWSMNNLSKVETDSNNDYSKIYASNQQNLDNQSSLLSKNQAELESVKSKQSALNNELSSIEKKIEEYK